MNILEIKELNFRYSDLTDPFQKKASDKYALKDVSLNIPQGSIVTVCGPTGSGKSTLLRLLKQEIAPEGELTGDILYAEKPIRALTEREQAEKISILFQNPEDQIVTDKVWHEIAFGLENLGYSQSEMDNRVAEMLSFFRLESISGTETDKLSGGQKQQVLLASLFAVSPEVLLLDEPISQLDPEASEQFIHTLTRLHEKLGITIIIAEHKIQNLLPISDMVVIMSGGRIVAAGSPDEVKDDLESVLPPITCQKQYDPEENEGKQESILSMKNIFFRYSLKSADVINSLNADFKPGVTYAIFGCNAAGKTTLLNIISGLYKPQEGSIKFSPAKPKIAYMPQNVDLLFLSDTVNAELKNPEIKPSEKPEYIKNLDVSRSPYDLSGGEKQLLALAKLSAPDPDIILLDEPTKGMDVILSKILIDELKKFTENGKTVIMSTHDLAFAKASADMCSIMSMGRLTAFKTNKIFFETNKLYSI